ncbi:MAG: LpxI family protein [Firmicutes bacterium]|nr:LpxI family protein [Bacillota bacterium]
MAKLAVLAGKGNLPRFFAERAAARGHEVVLIDFLGEVRPELAQIASSSHFVPLGQWQRVIDTLKQENVTDVYLLGSISKGLMFSNLELDRRLLGLLANLREKNDNAVIEAFVQDLAREGIVVRPQTELLEDALLGPGVLTDIVPDDKALADIGYGLEVAKVLAGLDIGQTVVVKDGAVLAVEAIDGTDATISRGGTLAKGGGVVVKVAKPDQDLRFDVPTIGLDTIETVIASGLKAIALEAGRTIIVDVPSVVERANRGKVSVVLVKPEM